MADTVIQVRDLSKRYRLGAVPALGRTFGEMIHGVMASAAGRMRGRAVSPRREFWALRDVSFDVRRGEVVGIVGANGAGKSTLLKILSRITEPTRGWARLRGRVGSLLEVGTGFHPELTGRENIYLSGAVLGMTRRQIDGRFEQIVEFAGVDQFLDTPVKRYSSGMYVRLAFAVAAHLEPQILIVDEVLAVGDAAFQQRCLGKMGDAARAGRTVLLVSHNLDTVRRFCQRCLLLSRGRLEADGEPTAVVARYLGEQLAEQREQGAFNPQRRTIRPRGVRIVDAWTAKAGRRESVFSFGESMEVHVGLEAQRPVRVALEVVIRDDQDHPVVFLPSGLRFNREFELRQGSNTLVCRVGSLPLAQGRYTLDLIAADSGRAALDCVQSALGVLVANCDPCGTGHHFRQETRQGCVHVDAEFQQVCGAVGRVGELRGAVAA